MYTTPQSPPFSVAVLMMQCLATLNPPYLPLLLIRHGPFRLPLPLTHHGPFRPPLTPVPSWTLLNSCLAAQAYQLLTWASVRTFFATTNQLLYRSITSGRTLACSPDPPPPSSRPSVCFCSESTPCHCPKAYVTLPIAAGPLALGCRLGWLPL